MIAPFQIFVCIDGYPQDCPGWDELSLQNALQVIVIRIDFYSVTVMDTTRPTVDAYTNAGKRSLPIWKGYL